MPNAVREVTTPATSTPIAGSMSQSGVTVAFVPVLGRAMYLTLAGTWAGSVQVERSVDGGTTWNAVTIGGGNPWLAYNSNCDENIDSPTDAAGTYRLNFNCASGTLTYRLAQ